MATNKEKIYKYIQKQFLKDQEDDDDKGVDTEEIVDYLNIKRSNASALLNQLVKENLLEKTTTRPVHYHLSYKICHNAFDDVVGSNNSLAESIRQAKAAINFPGGALPIHIVATPGSGTTYFSKIIIKYAKDQKIIPADATYHEINCLLLEDKPQQLNEELFGKDDNIDLLQRYKNSVVIINHYEKLDSAQIYRINHILDEYKNQNNNLIILSTVPTNENKINIPIQIKLPLFNERPLSEKLTIIEMMFEKQAKNSGKPIIVGSDLVLGLAKHVYDRGFKSLSKLITLASAKAYLRSLDNNESSININHGDLPDTFVFNKTLDVKDFQEAEELINNRERFIFKGNIKENTNDIERRYEEKLYKILNNKYQNLSQEGLSPEKIQRIVFTRVEKLFNEYGFKRRADNNPRNAETLQELSKIVPQNIINLTSKFLTKASKKLDRKFNHSIFYGLCLHINSVINLGTSSHQEISDLKIIKIRETYPKEYDLTHAFAAQLNEYLHYSFDEEQIINLLMFLIEPKQTKEHPVVLYAMHGKGAAHCLSEVTNKLNDTYNSFAYDMQLNKSLDEVYSELRSLVLKINRGQGIIVIYDMGSFKDIFNRIIDETNIPIRLINIPITLVGLEVTRRALNATNIDDIYHDVLSNLQTWNNNTANNKQNMIITLCHTGEGGAVQLKDYIEQYSHLQFVVKAMSISDRDVLAKNVQDLRKIYNIRSFIGTYNPNLFGIPFISITKVFENNHKDLDKILSFIPVHSNSSTYDRIYDYYNEELKYTPVDKLKETMPQVLDSLNEQYELNEDQRIGVFTHIVGIIENALSGKPRQQIDINVQKMRALESDFAYLEKVLAPVEKKFNMVFNNSDLYTIAAILKKL